MSAQQFLETLGKLTGHEDALSSYSTDMTTSELSPHDIYGLEPQAPGPRLSVADLHNVLDDLQSIECAYGRAHLFETTHVGYNNLLPHLASDLSKHQNANAPSTSTTRPSATHDTDVEFANFRDIFTVVPQFSSGFEGTTPLNAALPRHIAVPRPSNSSARQGQPGSSGSQEAGSNDSSEPEIHHFDMPQVDRFAFKTPPPPVRAGSDAFAKWLAQQLRPNVTYQHNSKHLVQRHPIQTRPNTFAVLPLVSNQPEILPDRQTLPLEIVIREKILYWLYVYCYELDQQVGETEYSFSKDCTTIDGFCSMITSNRLCLAAIDNPARTPQGDSLRRQIGNGIRLQRENGEITLQVLSTSPVFVQAPLLAHERCDDLSTVYRLPQGCIVTVFRRRNFERLLSRRKNDFKLVYDMNMLSKIRVSFGKGYGGSYNRRVITETPCWVECVFQEGLQLVDAVLRRLPRPSLQASSP